MIHEVEGDILLTRAHAIAHGVAPGDHFDQGLALSLRERWPAMYKDFRHWMHQAHPKEGELWAWAGAGGPRLIALFTQKPAPERGHGHAGRATLANVNHALRALAHYLTEEKIPSVALPRLATGVGGLDWDDVRPLIQRHLGELPIPVHVYVKYVRGQQAEEPE